jgi:hypothetical protein
MGRAQAKTVPMHFHTMVQADVPQGRNGKHKEIVTTVLTDLDRLKAGSALKIPWLIWHNQKKEFVPR